jgi:5-methylcytosine-specific restriction enzyme A
MEHKYLILVAIIFLTLIFINYKFNGIIIKIYNYASKAPKFLLITVGIVIVIAPILFKKKYNEDDDGNDEDDGDNEKTTKTEDMSGKLLSFVELATGKDLSVLGSIRGFFGDSKKQKKDSTWKIGGAKEKRNVSGKMKKFIGAQQKWECAQCKKTLDETYEVDHIVRLADGGNNEANNLQALCPQCHRTKTFHEEF